MQLSLIRNDRLHCVSLPAKVGGQVWVTADESGREGSRLVSVEGVGGRWVLKSTRRAWIHEDSHRTREVTLSPNRFYRIVIEATGEQVLLRSEPATADRHRYTRLALPRSARLRIGRGEDCHIRCESGFISTHHADLVVAGESVAVEDSGSANGTFVNACRVENQTLRPGDVISLFGLTIVVGNGFIAVNDPDGLVTWDPRVLTSLPPQEPKAREDLEMEEGSAASLFYRSPRFKRDIVTAEFVVDPPPQQTDRDEMPLLMVVGPALTMGLASLLMGIFAVVNVMGPKGSGEIMQALPTLIMSLTMMTGMILWPILARRQERRKKAEREDVRQNKYRAYIDDMRTRIDAERRNQSDILTENIVTLEDCVQRIQRRERGLWERTTSHGDFLGFRLGIGEGEFDAEIKHAPRKFTLDDDDLQDIMLELAERPKTLPDVPVAMSLLKESVLGIIGERGQAVRIAHGIVTQLVALHGYDELKLVFIYDRSESESWEFARWLPHTWNDDRSIRFIATTADDLARVSAVLEPELARREELRGEDDPDLTKPHHVVFALDRNLAGKTDLVARILRQKTPRGFYVVALYDELRFLPRECRSVIDVEPGAALVYDPEDTSGASRAVRTDVAFDGDARELAVQLANTELDTMRGAFVLPDVVSFLELHGVGKVEHLNALTRWRESNPAISLEAAVGIGSNGDPLMLDVHEKRHGPHGLIAGMTGSGKSEFIMTYILSLAISYAPHEVAFVLIDYKGGGMANAFVELPHVAGTVTNLDGAAVNRSLVSIQSELRRRQAIFNEIAASTGTSNIDIYKYQRMYREGVVREPLPHLLIISDEFAELKSQQPEFMSQLVSAARIGRSLGIHLILATQKPSGVVDDQIWSNSRFRVCLKVQEKADSMEVIKRPDAAALTGIGRFFLQVGFNELFDLGQSAWAGAPYYPADRLEKSYDDSVVVIDDTGRPLRQARPDRRPKTLASPSKQLDEVARYLAGIAAEEHLRARPLWLDPIPAEIFADSLRAKYARGAAKPGVLDPMVGEYDDPANQRQALLTVPLTADGNAVVYGSAGSGKTGFVVALVLSLLQEHTPEEVHLYILDFEAETLRAFQAAPHVGDVLCSYEEEKVENLFKLLNDEIARRRRLFSDHGGDITSYRRHSGRQVESIVVVIHNYSAFSERYDGKEESIAALSREGVRYGIYFVLTAASTTAIRLRILQNFKQFFVLQLNDPGEYSSVLGNIGGVVPSPLYGRGIVKTDGVYEFQTAKPSMAATSDLDFVRAASEELARAWQGPVAPRVPVLPTHVTMEALAGRTACPDLGAVPVGIDARTLDVVEYDLRRRLVTLVVSQTGEVDGFISALAQALAEHCQVRTIVLDADAAVSAPLSACDLLAGEAAVNRGVAALYEEMVRRNNTMADARATGDPEPAFDGMVVLVPSLGGLLEALDEQNSDRFRATLLKCDASLGASFVLADSEALAANHVQQAWLRPHHTGMDGIWIGDGLATQYTLQAARTSSSMYDDIGPEFGYVLTKGKARLTKLLTLEDQGQLEPEGTGGAT